MSNTPTTRGPQDSGGNDSGSAETGSEKNRAKQRYQRCCQCTRDAYSSVKRFLKSSKTDHWLAIGTWALVIVTWILVLDARDAIEKSQRAWVAPIGAAQTPGANLKNGQIFHFDVEYTNTGREPALDVDIIPAASELLPLPNNWEQGDWTSFRTGPNNTCGGQKPITDGPVIYPMTFPAKYQQGYYVSGQENRDRLINFDAVLVVKGCFVYVTGNKVHESAYCIYLQPVRNVSSEQWIFKICNEGNHAN